HAPGCNLVECLWGDEFGVKLHLSGKSIPNYTGKVPEDGNDKVLGWWTLYQDPYCELRSLAAEGGANQLAPPGRTPAWKQLDERIKAFTPSSILQQQLSEIGFEGLWEEAFKDVINSAEYGEAIKKDIPH